MNYFISDTHFGHANMILFENRPFDSCYEMDEAMVNLWNNKVSRNDNVYILGDFAFGNARYVESLLKRLKGKKYLVKGNHDYFLEEHDFDYNLFEWVKDYHDMKEDNNKLVLFHYPIAVWDCSHRNSLHLYGHIHDEDFPATKYMENSYNACAKINNYVPCTLNEIIQNNSCYKNLRHSLI